MAVSPTGIAMIEVITAGGLALCSALHMTCQSPFEFARLLPVSEMNARTGKMEQRQWRAEIPPEYRYEYYARCLDARFFQNAQCGFYDQCIVVATFVDEKGSGSLRLCRRSDEVS